MNNHSIIDADGHVTIQRFVTDTAKKDRTLIIALLRNKFGSREQDFRPFHKAWLVRSLPYNCM